jgi:hypothetical protein
MDGWIVLVFMCLCVFLGGGVIETTRLEMQVATVQPVVSLAHVKPPSTTPLASSCSDALSAWPCDPDVPMH